MVVSLLIFCYACTNNTASKQTSGEVFTVDLKSAQPVEDVLEKISQVSLENKGDTFPGFVHKMLVVNDTLYLLDTFTSRGLYAYDSEGCFLYAYNQVGQGEQEFIGLADFQVYGDTIYLLDTSGKKIIKLNKQGKYLSSTRLSTNPLAFAMDKWGGTWMDVGNTVSSEEAYTLLYKQGITVQNVVPIPRLLYDMTYAPFFTLINVGDKVHFLPEMQNCIYSCDRGRANVVYHFDFGKHWYADDFLAENKKSDFRYFFQKVDEAEYVNELNFLESDRLLLLSFNCGLKSYVFIYDKETCKQLLSVKDKDESFRPLAICGDEILFIEMTESCNIVSRYRWL